MSNPSKRKGTSFETAVVRYLNENGFPLAERRALSGNQDKGDVSGIPDTVIECKAARTFTLSQWMKELATEKDNANARFGFAVIKKPNHPVSKSYVVMEFDSMIDVLRRLIGDNA